MTAEPDREDLLVRVTTCSTLAAAVPGSVAQRQLLLPTARLPADGPGLASGANHRRLFGALAPWSYN